MTVKENTFSVRAVDEAGKATPCRVEAWRDGHCLVRTWTLDGCAELAVPAAGPVSIRIRSGLARDGVILSHNPATGPSHRDVVLRRRFLASAWGWYSGDCHRHAWRNARAHSATWADAGLQGAAEGLDFMLLAPPWDEQGTWLTAEDLSRRCAEAAPPGLALGWSLDAPKCAVPAPDDQTDVNACAHGHGWAAGLSRVPANPLDFATGLSYPTIQEIHRQGGVVGCAHPARMRLRQGRITAEWANELPFDFLSGSGYDAIDVLGPPADDPATAEGVWRGLLNMGYRVAATASTGGETLPGQFRTFVQVPGTFSLGGLADGIRRGACVASAGPLVLPEIEGAGPGSEFPADGRTRRLDLRAWSGPMPDETLRSVQIVRNGEIVQTWNLAPQNLRAWQGSFELRETGFAWYAVRATSSTVDPGGAPGHQTPLETAIASPVYFLPPGFSRPAPAVARLRVRVTDSADRDVPSRVTARVGGIVVASQNLPVGHTILELPAGARLTFEAPGFAPETRSAFSDSPLAGFCRDLGMAHLAQDPAGVWRDMQRLLDHIDLPIRLLRLYDFSRVTDPTVKTPPKSPERKGSL